MLLVLIFEFLSSPLLRDPPKCGSESPSPEAIKIIKSQLCSEKYRDDTKVYLCQNQNSGGLNLDFSQD